MSNYESVFTLLVFSNILWYGIIVLLLIIGLLLGYQKKKTQLGLSKKIQELERTIGSQQFFYGNLDAIKQHILQNSPMEAAMYVTEFTNLLRTLSNNSKQKSISLAQEIETILLYLELEKKRIGGSFVFFQEINATIKTEDVKVTPMFAFKQIEALIQQRNSSLNLHLIIRSVGQKLTCSSENTPRQTKFFIDVPARCTAVL